MSRPKRKRVPLGSPPSGLDLRVVEAVTQDDRAWFGAHPGETVRWRPMVPGETVVESPAPPGCAWVIEVTRLAEGARTRRAHLAQVGSFS